MKSKSLNLGNETAVKLNSNMSYDFINYYQSAAETKTPQKKIKQDKQNNDMKSEPHRRNKQTKQAMHLTQINIDGPGYASTSGLGTPLMESAASSTPLAGRKPDKAKSIIKSSAAAAAAAAAAGDAPETTSKPKKRNKSVSFMLEDTDKVAVKKNKSNMSMDADIPSSKEKFKKNYTEKKHKKYYYAEKENKVKKEKKFIDEAKTLLDENKGVSDEAQTVKSESSHEKKKRKHSKRSKKLEDQQPDTKPMESMELDLSEKKKMRETKSQPENDHEYDEPAAKLRKKEIKVIAKDLENLSIGDNPSNVQNLSSLLDDMSVVDKDKRKKLKKKKDKKSKEKKDKDDTKSSEEKKKWKKKRWNKEKRETHEKPSTCVIVDGLPLSVLLTYKKLLTDHFSKCGLLRNVGVAEMCPTERSQRTFSTTIYFDNEEAVTKALESDKTCVEGVELKVKRALPPADTTAVVRSYGLLTEQSISAAFGAAGHIRVVRIPAKGKKAITTAFIEFDGPEAVERAIEIVSTPEPFRINGKKIYISKFKDRKNKDKSSEVDANDGDHGEPQGTQN